MRFALGHEICIYEGPSKRGVWFCDFTHALVLQSHFRGVNLKLETFDIVLLPEAPIPILRAECDCRHPVTLAELSEIANRALEPRNSPS